jgi:hypothetical protein
MGGVATLDALASASGGGDEDGAGKRMSPMGSHAVVTTRVELSASVRPNKTSCMRAHIVNCTDGSKLLVPKRV